MRKRLKNKHLQIGILLFISILIWNCKDEEVITPSVDNQADNSVKIIKQNFTLDSYQDNFVKDNLKIKWNNYNKWININSNLIKEQVDKAFSYKEKDNKINTYEFETNLKSAINSPDKSKRIYTKTTLIAVVNSKNQTNFELLKYKSFNETQIRNVKVDNLTEFNGTIDHTDLNGKVTMISIYKRGELIQSFKDIGNKKELGAMAPTIGYTLIPIFVEHWKDIYKNTYGGSTYFYYVNSHYEGTTVEYVYVNTGFTSYGTYHGHFDDPHGPPGHPDNHPNEIIIDSLDPCSKNIFNLVQSANSIRTIINQFAGENSQFSWTLETSSENNFENSNNSAETSWLNGNKFFYRTRIGSNYSSSATKLSIARTLIHEGIHAYILSYIDLATQGGVDTQQSIKMFPELWNDLVARKYGDPNTSSGWNLYHHQEMARNYVNTIADALAQWDNYQNSNQYYHDLAWGGLLNTQIFQQTTDLTDNDRLRISNINNAEDSNTSDAKSNPCN
jgi:hypothetical protein